ncbi:uncharacterized protein V6R79_004545 [Siganus canaliculatus]
MTAACTNKWKSAQFLCDVTSNNASQVLFDCTDRYLRDIPEGITTNATNLTLSENYIQNISVKSFSNLPNLIQISLDWANKKQLLTIANDTFRYLTKLQDLKLSGNNLRKIPRNLPASLRNLALNNNKILSLENSSFHGLSNITHFQMSNNCYFWNPCHQSITVMDGSLAHLPNLQHLDLSFNNLTQVPKGLPQSLVLLSLASNQIQYISEWDFSGLGRLKTLKIEGNCQRCQNAPYPCVPCHNLSLTVHQNAFQSLTQLETLNLGGNSLKTITPSWFEKMKNLKNLFLAFNYLIGPITQEGEFLNNLGSLERIDLSFNFNLNQYPKNFKLAEEFSNLTSLRILHMEGLVFQEIRNYTLSCLYTLKNLSILNLGTNFIISTEPIVFSNLQRLKLIYLTENKLFPIPKSREGYNQGSGFSIPPLLHPPPKSFELEHNLVKQECFDSGRVLTLSSNNLFFISPEQFQDYGNIACLNLSGNGFSAALNGTEFALLNNLTYLDLSFNKINLAYSYAFKELAKLEVLDISHNDHYFKTFGVSNNLNFTRNLSVLRVLNMSYNFISALTTRQMHSQSLAELRFTHNNLGTLWKERDGSYNMLFTNLTNLTILDISNNGIKKIPDSVYEYLPRNLTTLYISRNSLSDFKWDSLKFFSQLRILDLSFNNLHNVSGMNSDVSHTLTSLILSNNGIFHLEDGFLFSLTTLDLSSNQLTIINQSSIKLKPESQLQTLFLQSNPFQCTCDSLDFILWIRDSNVKIPRMATQVRCGTHGKHKGKPLVDFDVNQCVNDSQAFLIYILTHCFLIIFMAMTTVAHLFYWDGLYVLHYVKAKLKGYSSLNTTGSVYEVFVTYDTQDRQVSEWVMGNLRAKLEDEGEKHLPLCLEERDWTPGVPLMDNLTQSIQHSRKTLFVLTEGYVKTGIFKLAMYLAHQRLLDENVDVIVLLMLEPVLQHSHFLRLRKRLCGRSVVEWPRTAAAEPWFWQNLRSVVREDNQVMYNKAYSKYFTNK